MSKTGKQKIVFKKRKAKDLYDLYIDQKNIQRLQAPHLVFPRKKEENIPHKAIILRERIFNQ
jgi:hypothetical protein